MTSPFQSPNASPAWGAATIRGGGRRSALAAGALLATYMAAWTFLALAVGVPAARLSAAAPRAAPAAAAQLARAEEGRRR